jgi:hypothetical protein
MAKDVTDTMTSFSMYDPEQRKRDEYTLSLEFQQKVLERHMLEQYLEDTYRAYKARFGKLVEND